MHDVAVVVGGGASGVMASVRLLATGWQVVLVDPQAAPGRGIAYRSAEPWHRLNAPVAAMSAFADRPDDFLRWCRRHNPATRESDFVPRSWYGDYLSDLLREADSGRLTTHRATVARVFETGGSGFAVLLSDGVVIPADQVVLALGHAPPADPVPLAPEVRASQSYVADPWQTESLADLGDGPVLLVGTGLTAYDVALSLARAKPGRAITAVSRHGLTPQPHRSGPQPVGHVMPVASGSLASVMRRLRHLVAEHGGDWRAVMDAHRPHWNRLWDGLSEPDQRRFLRHLARFWEVHRHRVAPTVAEEVKALRHSGRLTVAAGELCGLVTDDRGGVLATLRYRTGVVTQRFTAVVNCTGPASVVDSSRLISSLVAEGLARPGPYRLGLDTDRYGALVQRDGSVSRALWTLGPPRRGTIWETTAVAEIRAQAHALAQRIRISVSSGHRHPTGAVTAEAGRPGA